MNELVHLGRGLVGLVAAIFRGLADFVKWASGQQHVDGRPHPILVADVPTTPALPPNIVGEEDTCNPSSSKDMVLLAEVAHSNVLRAMAESRTVHE